MPATPNAAGKSNSKFAFNNRQDSLRGQCGYQIAVEHFLNVSDVHQNDPSFVMLSTCM